MFRPGLLLIPLCFSLPPLPAYSVTLTTCTQSARSFFPCELTFEWREGELPLTTSSYASDLLSIEFRSPRHTTYLVRSFSDMPGQLRVRFSPTEPGPWTYHVTSAIKRYNDQESTFNVADSGSPGFVSVANVRHWWTTNKQPHLWFSASAPFLDLEQSIFESWLEARKHDGFTHIRGPLLTAHASNPLKPDFTPNLAYFAALDDRLLAAANRGFTLDLLLADDTFARSPAFENADRRELILRYLVARYGALNVTWQGLEHYENVPNSRALLQHMGLILQKYDPFRHPASTGALVSSSPLLPDKWMNYIFEASPHPEVGAVEHQFTQSPQVHLITATDPDAFRRELWNSTTNGEYPTVTYESLRNEANLKAVKAWFNLISNSRHWELEPYFDVSGARATGLEEVEYIAYAAQPGIVEISLPKHKYNPVWVNPITGDEIPLKDYKGDVFSRQTPDNSHDWVLSVPREGHKESMLRSWRFESQVPPVQEIEGETSRIPLDVIQPEQDTILSHIPIPYQAKLTKSNRSTRTIQMVWWGEIGVDAEGARLLGVGLSGTFTLPKALLTPSASTLTLRVEAINANGKAYEVDRVYPLAP